MEKKTVKFPVYKKYIIFINLWKKIKIKIFFKKISVIKLPW